MFIFILGPPRLPIYGSYYYIRALDFSNLTNAFTKLSKIYKTKIVGCFLASFPAVVVDDPDLIKEMLYNEDCDGRMDVILFRLRSYWKKLGKFSIASIIEFKEPNIKLSTLYSIVVSIYRTNAMFLFVNQAIYVINILKKTTHTDTP